MESYYYQNGGSSYAHPPPRVHLCFFLLTLLLFIGLSWYSSYESVLRSIMRQLIRLLLIATPVALLLAVHWLSSVGEGRRLVPFVMALPDEPEALHRAGVSPWGVGLLLVLLLFMVSYQSYFHVRWFPLIGR
ncbi:hypothetical protein AXF42_Ash011703 [Apostasia shenzhenica]|uniref:Uncharacterized protein n=1 Tax=Apostasia shenzhenica TaxID=1088818 RepID=A0A2H9ZUQ2_9ASPA|nr:hypothetical protein AXF42_Ash011703 [Apostasia shenzhenica]